MDATIAGFWDQVCGSSLARKTGLTSFDRATLNAFDKEYFAFYPYLSEFIRPALGPGKDVLEVGLGYGTVTHAIAESGARTTGLDISPATAAFGAARAELFGLPSVIKCGSILSPPFAPQSFDVVVSIGCIHHTGDMATALDRIAGLLRPGGQFLFMVYNAASYYRWLKHPPQTFDYCASRPSHPLALDSDAERKWYDQDEEGIGAPATAVSSAGALRRMLKPQFRSIKIRPQNFGLHSFAQRLPRSFWLATVGRVSGLDLYASCTRR